MGSLPTVLITGASSGIGEETAYQFAGRGAHLFLVSRRQLRLEAVRSRCLEQGAKAVELAALDLKELGSGQAVVTGCVEAFGGIETLILNAGYGLYGPLKNISPAQMDQIWRVNFQSVFESIHAALPHLLRQQKGHLVLVSSILGKKAIPYAGAYSVTKFGLVALGDALWGELRGTGVGVSVICPGYTATEFQSSAQFSGGMPRIKRIGGQNSREVARHIVRAIEKRKREVHLTLPGKAICALERISPNLASWLISVGLNRLVKPKLPSS